MNLIEYIWLDGRKPVAQIRSKSRVIMLPDSPTIVDFPEWSFDGSSTNQAPTDDSDCILKPVCFVIDPLLYGGDYLALCEVYGLDHIPDKTNSRARLRAALNVDASKSETWFGFEQEYTMLKNGIILGWPIHGYPAPQGSYYCGVGTKQVFGRALAMEHAKACINAGLIYYGLNAEVMPGQWEFQIGYRGNDNEDVSALNISDHTWIGRWLLHRISENYNIHISFNNKPAKGDWNGSGMHTNFSTKATRNPNTGLYEIDVILEKLKNKHDNHIKSYGYKLEERLTGLHETSSIGEFSSGRAHRGCSVRIPSTVINKGCGHLEDRRPGANADPYIVAAKLISVI